MNNILITSAGQRVSLVRAFQKEVKKLDLNGKVYTIDLNPVLAPACHISDGYKSISKVTDEQYIDQLIHVCREWNIKIVIPTIDTELAVLAENKATLLNEGIVSVVSSPEFVKVCRDKRVTHHFFKERGIDTPGLIDKEYPSFPLFIKPYDGSLSKDTFLIKSKAELTSYHLEHPKLMFMEYIDQSIYDEYTVDAYYDRNGQLKCVVPRKRIFIRAGEVNKGVTHKNEIVKYISDRLSFISGVAGCLTMQFFFNKETKRTIGIEINPRFGGGYPLSYLAGANFPKYILEEYLLGKEIEPFDNWEDGLLMLRYDDEILVHNYED